MGNAVLVTGGTGFLGTELAGWLVRSVSSRIYALVRAESEEAALHRLRALKPWETRRS